MEQGDARTCALVEGSVYYLYIPFTGAVLDAVLDRIARVAARRPVTVCAQPLIPAAIRGSPRGRRELLARRVPQPHGSSSGRQSRASANNDRAGSSLGCPGRLHSRMVTWGPTPALAAVALAPRAVSVAQPRLPLRPLTPPPCGHHHRPSPATTTSTATATASPTTPRCPRGTIPATMRFSLLPRALSPFLFVACHATPPVHAVPAAHPPEIGTPSHSEEPHEDHVPVRPRTAPLTEISAKFVAGPAPASPGESPVVAIHLLIERSGRVERTVERANGSQEKEERSLEPDANRRFWAIAERTAAHGPFADELPVPDGGTCTIELVRGRESRRVQAALPTRHAELDPLLRELSELRGQP